MKIMKTAIAATMVLIACMNLGLLAADTTVTATSAAQSAQPKISSPASGQSLSHGWYGPGYDGGTGYYNPAVSGQYDPYPFYNIVGGEPYAPLYDYSLPNQNESPFNPPAAMTRHGIGALQQTHQPKSLKKSATQPVPTSSVPDAH